MRTVLLIEDNEKSREMLAKIVKNVDESLLIKSAGNIEEAYAAAMEYDIDLFLVDIILNPKDSGDVSGIRFADNIRKIKRYQYTPIVMITSLEDPKLYAYSDIHCYSYIEKPYDADKVAGIIYEALNFPKQKVINDNIFFRKDGILYKRKISEIVYIENSRNKRIIHSAGDDLELPYKPCREILAELNSDKFIQCSRYAIVNKDYIESIDTVNRFIKLKGRDEQIEIGIILKKKFLGDLLDD